MVCSMTLVMAHAYARTAGMSFCCHSLLMRPIVTKSDKRSKQINKHYG